MKKQNNTASKSIKDANKKIYNFLKSINELIKFKPTREFGFNALQQIDNEKLNTGLMYYYLYIKGKYFTLTYRESINKDIKSLETANDYFDDLFFLAKKENQTIINLKYLFVQAHTKYELSFHVKNELYRQQFLSKARSIRDKALKLANNNSSFIWLSLMLDT